MINSFQNIPYTVELKKKEEKEILKRTGTKEKGSWVTVISNNNLLEGEREGERFEEWYRDNPSSCLMS